MRTIQAIDLWNGPYLEHFGVKGMKWGVRKEYERKLRRSEKEYLRNREKSLKYIRKTNSNMDKLLKKGYTQNKILKNRKVRGNMKKALVYQKKAEASEANTWKIIGEVVNEGGSVKIKQIYRSGPTAKLATFASPVIASSYYTKARAYTSTTLNSQGETPLYMITNKYKVKGSGRRATLGVGRSPLQWYRRRQFNALSAMNTYKE